MLIQNENEHETAAGGELPKETQQTNTLLKEGKIRRKKKKGGGRFFFSNSWVKMGL